MDEHQYHDEHGYQSHPPHNDPNHSTDGVGDDQNRSEQSEPKGSEHTGGIQNQGPEAFRNVRNLSEKTQEHTMSVRDVAKAFEDAGVPRTERSITKWCNFNRHGKRKLDCYFDAEERRYWITPQSVHMLIIKERIK